MEGNKYKYRGLSLADPVYYGELRSRAEYNRNNPTEAERILWRYLSGKALDGYKFRRQHVLDQFIVDFVCLSNKLIIEIDGGYHFTPDQRADDAVRTSKLVSLGYRVIRFTNSEVLNHLDWVLDSILKTLTEVK